MTLDPEQSPGLVPMSTGDIVDEAFDLYKRNFVLFAGIAAIVAVPASLLDEAVSSWFGIYRLLERLSASSEGPDLAVLGPLALYAMFAGAMAMIVHVLQAGALTGAVSERVLGGQVTLRSAYGVMWSNFWRLLGAWVLIALLWSAAGGVAMFAAVFVAAVAAGAGAMSGTAGIVAGVAVAIIAALAVLLGFIVFAVATAMFLTQLVVIEQVPVADALARNWALVKGRVWHLCVAMLGIGLGTTLIIGSTYASIQALLDYLVFPALHVPFGARLVATSAVSTVITVLAQPFISIAITLLYFDQRVRREGLDLALLDANLRRGEAA